MWKLAGTINVGSIVFNELDGSSAKFALKYKKYPHPPFLQFKALKSLYSSIACQIEITAPTLYMKANQMCVPYFQEKYCARLCDR